MSAYAAVEDALLEVVERRERFGVARALIDHVQQRAHLLQRQLQVAPIAVILWRRLDQRLQEQRILHNALLETAAVSVRARLRVRVRVRVPEAP